MEMDPFSVIDSWKELHIPLKAK